MTLVEIETQKRVQALQIPIAISYGRGGCSKRMLRLNTLQTLDLAELLYILKTRYKIFSVRVFMDSRYYSNLQK